MIEASLTLLKMALRLSVVFVSATLFLTLYLMTFSSLMLATQATIIADLFALLQIWLPFNLSTITLWLLGLATAYISYLLAQKAVEFIRDITD